MPTGTMTNVPDDKPMDDEHRNTLRRCKKELLKDMEPVKVLRQMVDPLLFTAEEEDEVKAGKTRHDRCEIFLDLLPRKGARAYETFKRTIEIVYPHLTSTILKAENLELRYELHTERANSANLRTRLKSAGKPICPRCTGLDNITVVLNWAKDDEVQNYKAQNIKTANNIRQLMEEKRRLNGEIKILRDNMEEITKKYEEIKEKYDKLVEMAGIDSTEMNRLTEEVNNAQPICGTLQKQLIKRRGFEGSVLLPKGEDFQSPGAIYTIKKEAPTNVVATRSSHGSGKANDVLNRKLVKDFTDCGTDLKRQSWWSVDLGENHLLFPTHYSLRHGKRDGKSVLRYWELQGSIDGKDCNWKNINTYRKKREFTEPFPYVTETFSVEGDVGAFRYFRILQTGQHSSKGFGIYLSGMEFYGILLKVKLV